MKELLNRAMRTIKTGSDGKLNFRQAERHMPGMFNGKATENTEHTFKVEAYVSTLKIWRGWGCNPRSRRDRS